MTALISAELLRLRTVRSPRFVAVGVLALMAVLAAVPLLEADPAVVPSPGELADSLRSLAFVGVLVAATFAASNLGNDFKRGAAAVTYLARPRRERVAAARALTYAALGAVFAATAAGLVLAVGIPVARAEGMEVGLSSLDAVRAIAGAGVGGAVFGAAGALLGTLTRNPTVAGGAIVGLNLAEGLLGVAGVGPYLPFGLLNGLIGVEHEVALPVAALLLTGYLTALALVVRVWALGRDLT